MGDGWKCEFKSRTGDRCIYIIKKNKDAEQGRKRYNAGQGTIVGLNVYKTNN